MRYYETLYIINPGLTEEDCKEVVTKFNDLVEKNGGVVTKVDEWGKKTLAYAVKKHDKGYYVLLQYCGEPSGSFADGGRPRGNWYSKSNLYQRASIAEIKQITFQTLLCSSF